MSVHSLNPAQREAVLCTEGPLLVLAGAGSGKTRVITHRVALLLELGHPPESIVSITFTNKAAEEMRHRLRAMVGKTKADALVLGTFHSLGARMMREHPEDFDVPRRFSILDQGDITGLIRSLMRQASVQALGGDKRYDPAAIAQRIGLWKNEFWSHERAQKLADNRAATDYDRIAASIYADYDDRVRSLGALDFDDLVCRIATSLRAKPEAKKRWTERFRYLLVDEYQDTNPAQFAMLQSMLGPEENLCVVGDDDQAIYGWRGAKVANILGFDIVFPRAKIVTLVENYRCRPEIVACANHVIANNTSRYDKQLIAQRAPKDRVWVVACADDVQETRWIGQKIRSYVVDDGNDPGNIAILYRSSRQAKVIEAQLKEHGIAYQILGGQAFYDRKEVKDAVAYLRVLVTPYDDLAVRRAMDVPHRGIGAKTIEKLVSWADENHKRLIDAVLHHKEIEGIAFTPGESLKSFASLIHRAYENLRQTKKVSSALRFVCDDIGLRDYIHKETGSEEATAARWSNIEWLFGAIERFEKRTEQQTKTPWHELLATIERPKDSDSQEGFLQGVVTLSTFHSAKGLEWPLVFIIGCEEGIMPHKRVEAPRISDAISGDIEEERRLFYVGITRARDELFLTRAKMRIDRGRETECLPSRFVTELPDDFVTQYDVSEEEKMTADDMDKMADALFARWGGAPSE